MRPKTGELLTTEQSAGFPCQSATSGGSRGQLGPSSPARCKRRGSPAKQPPGPRRLLRRSRRRRLHQSGRAGSPPNAPVPFPKLGSPRRQRDPVRSPPPPPPRAPPPPPSPRAGGERSSPRLARSPLPPSRPPASAEQARARPSRSPSSFNHPGAPCAGARPARDQPPFPQPGQAGARPPRQWYGRRRGEEAEEGGGGSERGWKVLRRVHIHPEWVAGGRGEWRR